MRLRFFPTLQAPSEARRGLAPFADQLDEACFADLKIVVSELITISVAHGATKPIHVSLTLSEGVIEGIVYDEGPGTRAIVRAREQRDNSLVLRIIDSLVDEWGTNPRQTRVWFRLAAKGTAQSSRSSAGDGAVRG
jgi:anti-sigma regulatory factor (Ser/Thr protein kinase)